MGDSGTGPSDQHSFDGSVITRRSLLGNSAAVALGVAIVGVPSGRALAEIACGGGSAGPIAASPIVADRWLELDLYWFRQPDLEGSARQFWKRFLPLYAGTEGYRGVILSIDWTVGPVMEWSGDFQQKVPVPDRSHRGLEEPVNGWIEEKAPLTGATEERKRQWAARFAAPNAGGTKPRPSDPWTYADLKKLSAALKETAERNGVAEFKVGMFHTGGRSGYGGPTAWALRHPEAFSPRFNPDALLHADSARMGGLPNGIPEGMPLQNAYAAQWGSLSKAVGFDAILLRDGIGLPVTYRRGGPWGPVASSPEVIRKATEGTAALVRKTKQANPDALVMMYSNGACAVSDWRSNGLDLESIAREGYLDIWIDQSWSGAWNEVGVRRKSFWNSPTQGWTYQLGYILLHAAVLADTKVRHYPLIETFDAWEDWDVLHSVPERLRWAIWAYSHAAVKTPHGLRLPAGSYISWCNRGDDLLSEEDVRFLAENINAAIADARQTTQVFGPTLVYSREAMEWQANHAHPDTDIKEWIDEQAASAMKWPLPILSVTRLEWLPQVQSDLFILQTPSHLAPEHTAYIARLISEGQPVAIFGDPTHGVDEKLAELAGLSGGDEQQSRALQKCRAEVSSHLKIANNIPSQFNVLYRLASNRASNETQVIYSIDGNPELTLNRMGGKRVAMWDPPDLIGRVSSRSSLVEIVKTGAESPVMMRLDGTMDLPLKQLWGNGGAPYALVAGVLNSLLSSIGAMHVTGIDLEQTMTISAWSRADGSVRILAGNLEEGIREDADMSRHATVVLARSSKAVRWQNAWESRTLTVVQGRLLIDVAQAGSVLLVAKG